MGGYEPYSLREHKAQIVEVDSKGLAGGVEWQPRCSCGWENIERCSTYECAACHVQDHLEETIRNLQYDVHVLLAAGAQVARERIAFRYRLIRERMKTTAARSRKPVPVKNSKRR